MFSGKLAEYVEEPVIAGFLNAFAIFLVKSQVRFSYTEIALNKMYFIIFYLKPFVMFFNLLFRSFSLYLFFLHICLNLMLCFLLFLRPPLSAIFLCYLYRLLFYLSSFPAFLFSSFPPFLFLSFLTSSTFLCFYIYVFSLSPSNSFFAFPPFSLQVFFSIFIHLSVYLLYFHSLLFAFSFS